nr:hypothetical protein Iba_chr14aCG2120 [Ipomoea batatas]
MDRRRVPVNRDRQSRATTSLLNSVNMVFIQPGVFVRVRIRATGLIRPGVIQPGVFVRVRIRVTGLIRPGVLVTFTVRIVVLGTGGTARSLHGSTVHARRRNGE